MKIKIKVLSTLLLTILLLQPCHAGRLVQIDDKLREQLEVLNLKGVIVLNISIWPLSSEAIKLALDNAVPMDEGDKASIEKIQRALNQTDKSKIQLVSNINGDKRAVVTGFEQPVNTVNGFGITVSHAHADGKLDYVIQATYNTDDKEPNKKEGLDGSYIGTKLGNHRLAFGSIPIWWGNGVDGSLIRSDAARPVTGFLMQRANNTPINFPVLSKLGNFNYQITAGQLQDYKAVPNAKLIGMRASFQPNDAFQIGASRSIMWGGEGRDNSLKSFGKALTGRLDNTYDTPNDISNQIAGFDAQLNLKPLVDLPMSIYGEFIGEDEAGGLPYKKAYLAGLKGVLPLNKQPWLWHAEWANTYYDLDRTNIIYGHSIYKDGYYQKGLPLGHPIGGDGEIISVGVSGNIDDSNKMAVKYANANVNESNQRINATFPTQQKLDVVELSLQHDFRPTQSVRLGLWGKRDKVASDHEIGGQLVYTQQF